MKIFLANFAFLAVFSISATFSQTPAVPFGSNDSYAYGTMQSAVANSAADQTTQSWFNYWKTNFTKDCGGGKIIAINNYNGGEAFSEGQGYGMLLAAYMGDKALFDGLLAGYKFGKNSRGVMNWTISCSNPSVSANGATDGDLDAAMGLVVANKQWPSGGYGSEATTLINAIKTNEFTTCNGKTVQKPGDAFGGCDCTNPSYYAVGYYRAFGKHTNDATFWNKAADDGLSLLLTARNSSTGLNPAWTDASGSITTGGNCNVAASGGGSKIDYQFDAARTPWRIVVDYLWWGTTESKQYLDKISTWANGIGVSNIKAGYSTSGNQLVSYKNSAFTGAFAIGTMATGNQTMVNNFYSWWTTNSSTSGGTLDDNPYFQNTLRVMYSLVASGNFWNPVGSVDPNPGSVPTVSLTAPANNASVTQGSAVNITATASSTNGASITSVEFFVDGVSVGSDNSSPYSFSTTTLSVGAHKITAKATDSNNKIATSTEVNITVTQSTNSVVSVSLTSPASGASIQQGTPVSLAATASSALGATITSVEFLIDGVSVGSDNSSPYTYSASSLSAGNHTVAVKATDSNGKTATSTAITITITPVDNTSVVTVNLTAPTSTEFQQGSNVDLSATASSTNNSAITKVEFYVDNNLVSTDNSSPYSFSVSNLAVGEHTIYAKAYDSNAQSATSSSKTITIKTTVPNDVPTVAVGQLQNPPAIDGAIDAIWNDVDGLALNKEIIPTVSSPADLSATFKTLWDNQYFYVLVTVRDDAKVNDSGDEVYKDDAIELFFDMNNDKSTTYNDDDVQYTFRWNDNLVHANPSGRSISNILFSIVGTADGYIMEARIPWSTLQGTPVKGDQIGFDLQVNDDDNGGERDGKLSWAAPSDDAWQNPSLLGNGTFTGIVSGLNNVSIGGMKVYPNPFVATISIDGLQEGVSYTIMDINGKPIESGETSGRIETNVQAGVYNLVLRSKEGKSYYLKMVKTNN